MLKLAKIKDVVRAEVKDVVMAVEGAGVMTNHEEIDALDLKIVTLEIEEVVVVQKTLQNLDALKQEPHLAHQDQDVRDAKIIVNIKSN